MTGDTPTSDDDREVCGEPTGTSSHGGTSSSDGATSVRNFSQPPDMSVGDEGSCLAADLSATSTTDEKDLKHLALQMLEIFTDEDLPPELTS